MNLSPHFHELLGAYTAELGDLRYDSEGRDVLADRLRDKRSESAELLKLLDVDLVMVAPVLHGAFRFHPYAAAHFAELLAREPDDFGGWQETAAMLEVAPWARPLVGQALDCAEGEAFLTTVAALEFAWWRIDEPADEPMTDGQGDDEHQDERDAHDRRVDDFLEEQGFDRRSAD